MNIFTIGFTKKTAREFFTLIEDSAAVRLIDVRLNNVSQLAGFAKRDDLQFFLGRISGIAYSHELSLAPTKKLLDEYKKMGGAWTDYERQFLMLMDERKIAETLDPDFIEDAVLLCSEATAHQCHRRLVAEYLADRWENVSVTHL